MNRSIAKKIMSLLLTLTLVLSLAPALTLPAMAAGTADTNWYTTNPSATNFTISNADQLAGLATIVNNGTNDFSGRTIKLDENGTFDLSGYVDDTGWTPIGTAEHPFKGYFDGGNCTISKLTINATAPGSYGLFGVIQCPTPAPGYALQNINLTDVSVSYTGTDSLTYVGGLAGSIKGSSVLGVYKCTAAGTVGISGYAYAGGLFGYINVGTSGSVSLQECSNSTPVSSSSASGCAGGLVGMLESDSRFFKPNNTGAVTSVGYAGGIAGTTTTTYLENATNSGAITTDSSTGAAAGGIIADAASAYFGVANNTGNVSGYTRVGGIVGHAPSLGIANAYNTGKITGQMLSGGLAGEAGGTAAIQGGIYYSFNVGDVAGADAAAENISFGGIVGSISHMSVFECFNSAAVSGYSQVGGIIGLSDNSTVYDCYNTGTFPNSSIQSAGGLVGSQTGTLSILKSYSAAAFTNNQGAAYNGYQIISGINNPSGITAGNLFYDIEVNGGSLSDDSGLSSVNGATCTALITKKMVHSKILEEGDPKNGLMNELYKDTWVKRTNDTHCYYPELKKFNESADPIVQEWSRKSVVSRLTQPVFTDYTPGFSYFETYINPRYQYQYTTELHVTLDKPGKIRFGRIETGGTMPTVDELFDDNYNSFYGVVRADTPLTAPYSLIFPGIDVSAGVDYNIYVAAMDNEGNKQIELTVLPVSVSIAPDPGDGGDPGNPGGGGYNPNPGTGTTTYTITYDLNDGSGTIPTSSTVVAGNSQTLPGGTGLTKKGYTFGGWSTTKGGPAVSSTYTPSGPITLYAVWTADTGTPTEYTITYDLNDGSGTIPTSSTVVAGNSQTLPGGTGLTKRGYTFGGWSTTKGGPAVSSTYTPSGSITLYAVWVVKASTPGHTLSGTVTDDNGNGAGGATVQLKDLTGKVLQTVTTDGSGHYTLDDVATSQYVIVVTKGTETSTRTVYINENMTENFILSANVLTLTASPASLVGDGTSYTTLTATVMSGTSPVPGVTVTFSAPYYAAGFQNGTTAVTDANGKATIIYTSKDMTGSTSYAEFPVTAVVDDTASNLHIENQIVITFTPATIAGVVKQAGVVVSGAKVLVQKDIDGDGIVDFFYETTTAADGSYTIPVPMGNTTYTVSITTGTVTYQQTTAVGAISGVGESFSGTKTVTGALVQEAASSSIQWEKLLSDGNTAMRVLDSGGAEVTGATVSLDKATGIFDITGLSIHQSYTVQLAYPMDNGTSIVIGTAAVSLSATGEINIYSVLIDPYGVITDSSTGNPIPDVTVTLHYYNDGSRVDLPGVAGFEPAGNENPQRSALDGTYAFMVYPNTDYYITAVKSGYETFTSGKISVGTELVNYDFHMTKSPSSSAPTAGSPSQVAQKTVDYAAAISSGTMKTLANGTVDFTITYENKSADPFSGTIVTATIPNSMSYVTASDGAAVSGNTIKWVIGTLAGGKKGTVTFTLKAGAITEAEAYAVIQSAITSSSAAVTITDKEDDSSSIKILLVNPESEHTHTRYIKGYPDRTVKPENTITRAETAAIFARLAGSEAEATGTQSFSDVSVGDWDAKYIEVVSKLGIFTGYSDGTFKPNQSITRAELAMVIARYLGISRENDMRTVMRLSAFTDIAGYWAEQSIDELYRYQIIAGYADGRFKPEQGITRAEAIKMINRMLYRGPLTGVSSSYPDNTASSWYFEDMEEACVSHSYTLDESGKETLLKLAEEPLW